MADRQEAKRALRRDCFGRLKAMTPEEKAVASSQIRESLAGHERFRDAPLLAAYVALPSEPVLDPLILDNLHAKHWRLPRVDESGQVEMRAVTDFSGLIIGEIGIREPDPVSCPLVSDEDISLILIPGVGFDPANGARLGRGKGHYDRFLERLRRLPVPPPVWGVCFSIQLVNIDPESHDQPVDAIVTERGFAVP